MCIVQTPVTEWLIKKDENMYKNIEDADSHEWIVIDLDSRERLYKVQEADDETGEYTIFENKSLIKKQGNIRFIHKSWSET